MAPTTFDACNVERNFTDWPALTPSDQGTEVKGKGKRRVSTKRGNSTEKEQEKENLCKQQQVCSELPRLLGQHSESLKPSAESESTLKQLPGLALEIPSCTATDYGSNCSSEVTEPSTATEPIGDTDGKASSHREEEENHKLPAWLLPKTSISSFQVQGPQTTARTALRQKGCQALFGTAPVGNNGQLKRMSLQAYGENILADIARYDHCQMAATSPATDTLYAPSHFVNLQAQVPPLLWNGAWSSPLPEIVDPVAASSYGEIPAPPGLDVDVHEPRRIPLKLAGRLEPTAGPAMLDFQRDALVAGATNRTCTCNESSKAEIDVPMKVDLTKLACANF